MPIVLPSLHIIPGTESPIASSSGVYNPVDLLNYAMDVTGAYVNKPFSQSWRNWAPLQIAKMIGLVSTRYNQYGGIWNITIRLAVNTAQAFIYLEMYTGETVFSYNATANQWNASKNYVIGDGYGGFTSNGTTGPVASGKYDNNGCYAITYRQPFSKLYSGEGIKEDYYYQFSEIGIEPGTVTVPITYIVSNVTASGPSEGNTGSNISVTVTPDSGYIIRNPSQGDSISVYNKNGYIPFNYADGVLTFTVPDE